MILFFIKISSNKILFLDYTYFINRNIVQIVQYMKKRLMITNYNLLNNTNNEYTLQDVHNANSYIGVITSLKDV